MFEKVDSLLVVDRQDAEELFAALGCVNVTKWDADVLVQRLKRVATFCDIEMHVSEYHRDLIDAIADTGLHGGIVIRSTAKQKQPAVSLIDTYCSTEDKSMPRKKVRKPRKRGSLFSFEQCGIPKGATLVLKKDPSITCTVVGDPWVVDFGDGVVESFTARTRQILGVKDSTYLSPMHYWMYHGRLLRYYYNTTQKKKKSKSVGK